MAENAPLQLPIRPSYGLETFVALSYGLAAVALWVLPIPWVPKPLLCLGLGIGYAYGLLTRAGHGFPWSLTAVRWDEQGHWWLHLASGQVLAVRLLPSTYVSNWLVLLRFRAGLHIYAVPLCSDALDAESLRKLRVRLRQLARSSPD